MTPVPQRSRTLSRGAAASPAASPPARAKRPLVDQVVIEDKATVRTQLRQRTLLAKPAGKKDVNLELIGHENETLRGDLRKSLHDENEPSTEESSPAEDAERNAAPTTVQRRAQRRRLEYKAL